MASAVTLQLPSPRVGSGAERAAAVRAVLEGRRAVRHVLQPIVDIREGRVVGYEALARFSPRISTPPTSWFAAANRLRRSAELEAVASATGSATAAASGWWSAAATAAASERSAPRQGRLQADRRGQGAARRAAL